LDEIEKNKEVFRLTLLSIRELNKRSKNQSS